VWRQLPVPPPGNPSVWRVPQLKAFLTAAGVDHRTCIEKGQLEDLCRQLLQRSGSADKTANSPDPVPAAAPAAAVADAVLPTPQRATRICACCSGAQGEDGNKLRRCGACPVGQKVFYCSVVCQRQHWPQHQAVCGGNA
jgi:hypothetical protein